MIGQHVKTTLPVGIELIIVHSNHFDHGTERVVRVDLLEHNVAVGWESKDNLLDDGCDVATEEPSECVGLEFEGKE